MLKFQAFHLHFEHLSNDETQAAILLGENSNDGWFGNVSFYGCKVFTYDNKPFIKLNGDALADGEVTKTIRIDVLTGSYQKLIDLSTVQNVNGTSVILDSVSQDTFQNSNFNNVRVSYRTQELLNSANIYSERVMSTSDTLEIRPKIIDMPAAGVYRRINGASSEPWSNNDAGAGLGSLYLNTSINRWYYRVKSKESSDDSSKWSFLVPAIIGNGDPSGTPVSACCFYINSYNGDLWFGVYGTWKKITMV